MARKFLSIVILITYVFILGSCDSDDLRVEECKLDMNLFDCTYTVDDEGCCVLKGAKPISDDEVKSQVVGYGWKSIATYEVQANGKLNMTDYYDDLIGGAPIHYWFESSRQMVQYYYVDAMPADGFSRVSWTYDATKGYILCGDVTSAMADRYQQILKLDESNGKVLMYTIKKLGVKGDGKGGYEPFYGMVVYRRMTADELKKTQETYTYDFDKNGTVPDKTKFYIRAFDRANGDDGKDYSVFQTFRQVDLELVGLDSDNSSKYDFYNSYDSIKWATDCREMPDRFGIRERNTDKMNSKYWWSTYFFTPCGKTTIYAFAYKGGRVVYQAKKEIYLVNDGFFGYNWGVVIIQPKNSDVSACCLFDKSRQFVLTPPTAYKEDLTKPYAELRVALKGAKDKNDKEYMQSVLNRQKEGLIDIMDRCYGKHGTVNESEKATLRKTFKALPEDADIKAYWVTTHSRMVLVLKDDEKEPIKSEYYIHAEPSK